jgi:replicative DNA helicase
MVKKLNKTENLAMRKNWEPPPPSFNPSVPKNETAEKAVIACLLTGASPTVVPLTEAHFFFRDHKLIFLAALSLAQKGVPIDIMTVRAELELRKELENAGGDPSRFLQYTGGGNAVLEYYYAILEDARKNRDAVLYISSRIQDLIDLRLDASEFVVQLEGIVSGYKKQEY